VLIDGKDEGRDDRPADDTQSIDLPRLEIQIEALTRRTLGTRSGNGSFIRLVVQAEETSVGGRIGVGGSVGTGRSEIVLEFPRRGPVFIGHKDHPFLIIIERKGPRLIFHDEWAIQPIRVHRMKVSMPKGCSGWVSSKVVFHLALGWNGALILGWEPVRVRRPALMEPVPVNLGRKTR